jgi:hypothetical protein
MFGLDLDTPEVQKYRGGGAVILNPLVGEIYKSVI